MKSIKCLGMSYTTYTIRTPAHLGRDRELESHVRAPGIG